MSVRLIRCFVVLLMFSCLVYGQDIDITSFSRNGEIGWTNSVSNGFCTLEWASSLTGEWYSSWADLSDMPVTNEMMTTNVPMFYRVMWTSNNVSVLNTSQYIGAGDGSVDYETGDIWAGFTEAPSAGANILVRYYR